MTNQNKSARSRYELLQADREPFLRRARDAAALTVPALYPPETHNRQSALRDPYQSIGAAGVSSLAAKLMLTLFPPTNPFFEFKLAPEVRVELTQNGEEGLLEEYQNTLADYEEYIIDEIKAMEPMPVLDEVFQHLEVSGNALVHVPTKGNVRMWGLDKYVVSRDPSGNVLEIIVNERISKKALPSEIINSIPDDQDEKQASEETVDILTWIRLDGDRYKVHQELGSGFRLPGSESSYRKGHLPWIPLRFRLVSGESYGRGHIETLMGDLRSAEYLEEALVTGSLAAAKLVFLVKKGSSTKIRDLAKAKNGDFVYGDNEDVSTLALEKERDFRIVKEELAEIRTRLQSAFLMNASVQRDAERVTAYEISILAQELEDALGGVYALLAQELQLPFVKRVIDRMERRGALPRLPEDTVTPVVLTGMDALGRGHDLRKMEAAFSMIANYFGPEAVQQVFKLVPSAKRILTAVGMQEGGIVFTEEELEQMQQQAQMAQMAEAVGPEVVKQAGAAAQASE